MKSNLLNKTLCSLLISMSLGVISCSSGISEGEVYEKAYEPAKNVQELVTKYKKVGDSNIPFQEYALAYDDEDFILKIRKYDEATDSFLTNTLYVTESIYNSVNKGDYFNSNGLDVETSDPNVLLEAKIQN